MASDTSAIWAIVVGVDHYPSDRCLGGAVHDAEAVQDFLRGRYPKAQIRIFTATCPADTNRSQPREPEDLWPSWTNVVSSLKWIIQEANPGDVVYFHYSGHGTKLPGAATTEPSGEDQLAFVLFEDNEFGCRYLEGRHLASALHRMVCKGLIVTLVLDCCFSGSVARHGEEPQLAVRRIAYNQDAAAYSAQEYANSQQPFGNFRDANQEKDWLVDPDGYTILTACGPFETASEVQLGSVGRRGALSHYLLTTLHQLGASNVELSHRDLHQQLSATFHTLWPRQTPMRYGNSNRSFFGHLVVAPGSGLIPIFQHKDGSLRLRAGETHGICEGDEFVAYSTDQDIADMTVAHGTLKVSKVWPFESEITTSSANPIMSQTRARWVAKLSLSMASRKVRVKLTSSVQNADEIKRQAARFPFLSFLDQDEQGPCQFTISVSGNQDYIINKAYGDFKDLATVSASSHNAIAAVTDVLNHLGTFKFLEGIENRVPSPKFLSKLSIDAHSDPSASGAFEIEHGDIWGFTIENAHDTPLYFSVINFRDNWEIINVFESAGGDSYRVVDPIQNGKKGMKQLRLRMEVPQNSPTGHRTHCEDIIKVFVTNKPTRFPTMLLPPLRRDRIERGASCDTDKLQSFFREGARQFRGNGDDDAGEWVTRNFIIRTTEGLSTDLDSLIDHE